MDARRVRKAAARVVPVGVGYTGAVYTGCGTRGGRPMNLTTISTQWSHRIRHLKTPAVRLSCSERMTT